MCSLNGLEHRNQSEKLYLWGGFRENLRGYECDSECESESKDVLMDVIGSCFVELNADPIWHRKLFCRNDRAYSFLTV